MSGLPFSFTSKPFVILEQHSAFGPKRDGLDKDTRDLIETIVDSLQLSPDNTGDRLLPRTDIGDVWVRRMEQAYILYQVRSNEPRSAHLIKLWFCGVFVATPDGETFDFAE